MIKAVAICGPTASGKTALSLDLAKALSAEIISCDSMQIYRDMDIGTAKAGREEREAVPHHLIDFLSPSESYSAERYRADALLAAKAIAERGNLPLFVGGTGLYLSALLRSEQSEVPESDPEFREREMEKIKTQEDIHALWERLNRADPVSASQIHENNVRRVLRAIEIFEKTGKTKSYFDKLSLEAEREIDILVLSLDFHERANLYSRIDRRVDIMMENGLLAEVENLYKKGLLLPDTTAAQAIGYKELKAYLDGKCELKEAVDLIKQSSRRYAKRQLTWFRRAVPQGVMMDTENGEPRDYGEVICECLDKAKKFLEQG